MSGKNKKNKSTKIEIGTGNVFEQLGLPNPEERLRKAQLMRVINEAISRRGLSQAEIGQLTGLHQADISRIAHGRGSRYSTDRLLNVLARLGVDVQLMQSTNDKGDLIVDATASERRDDASGRCLFCDQVADSPEHFLPSGIGGRLRPVILCKKHNALVNEHCDDPLIKQLQFFVHALRVVKDRGEPGASITGVDEFGIKYTVDPQRRPRLDETVLARGLDRRPIIMRFASPEHAEKVLQTMSLPSTSGSMEHRKEPAPWLTFNQEFGGAPGFRGVLKIAYEFVRGYHHGVVVSKAEDQTIREALLQGANPTPFVHWLPFEFLQGDEAPYFSHRIIAWQDGDEVLVIVELFNTLPFIVRLPGLHIAEPILYVQGVQREAPLFGSFIVNPDFHWSSVPEHIQPLMFATLRQRMEVVCSTMVLSELATASTNCAIAAFSAAAPDESCESLTSRAVQLLGAEIVIEGFDPESMREPMSTAIGILFKEKLRSQNEMASMS